MGSFLLIIDWSNLGMSKLADSNKPIVVLTRPGTMKAFTISYFFLVFNDESISLDRGAVSIERLALAWRRSGANVKFC